MRFSLEQLIFLVITFVSAPLYISIIIIFIREWKRVTGQKTINLLLISQGIADLVLNLNFIVFVTLRSFPPTRQFFWNFQQYYVATWCINQYYVSSTMRSLGILLITIQRYLMLCCEGSALEQWTNSSNRWILVLIHWTFPFVYVLPVCGLQILRFNNPLIMNVVAPPYLMTNANVMAFSFVFPAFIVSLFCYSAILRHLFKHRLDATLAIKRERRVCVQMLGVAVAFSLCATYHVLQFVFSVRSEDQPLIDMRRDVLPIIICFMSYVSPWMMFLTTRELRHKVLSLYGFKRRRTSSNSLAFNQQGITTITPTLRVKPVT